MNLIYLLTKSKKKLENFFEMLYYLGLRKGEIQALTWNDIDFKKNQISINKTFTTKIKGEDWTITTPKTKNSIRILPLTEKIVNDLLYLNNKAIQFSDFKNKWFVFGNSVPFRETTITRKYENYRINANLKKL